MVGSLAGGIGVRGGDGIGGFWSGWGCSLSGYEYDEVWGHSGFEKSERSTAMVV